MDMTASPWIALLLVLFGVAVFVGAKLRFVSRKPVAGPNDLREEVADLREEVARLQRENERLRRALAAGSTGIVEGPP